MLGLLRKAPADPRGPAFTTRRLVLRHPAADDWSAWARLRGESREFLRPWEPTWARDALTRAAFRRRLRNQARDREAGAAYSFFAFRSEDDSLVGGVTLGDVRRGVAQAATLGYWIGQRFARRGYMTEAIDAIAAHAFDDLALHRLEAACLPVNEPSRRLLESRGFRLEGLARGYLRIDGAWRDHLLFALIDSDWRERIAREGRPP